MNIFVVFQEKEATTIRTATQIKLILIVVYHYQSLECEVYSLAQH
jgi:hypothetical protein